MCSQVSENVEICVTSFKNDRKYMEICYSKLCSSKSKREREREIKKEIYEERKKERKKLTFVYFRKEKFKWMLLL